MFFCVQATPALCVMFKVQRFTADDEEEESSGHDSTSILDSILQRAKSRAGSNSKRARLEPTTSTSVGDGGGGAIHEDYRANPGAGRRAKARATGGTVSGVAAVGRSATSSVPKAKHGGVRLLERDSPSDSVGAVDSAKSSDAEASEDGESEDSGESDESKDSGNEEEEEEGVDVDGEEEDEEEDEEGEQEQEARAGLEGGAERQAPEAGADGTGDVGEGLRPMEEVADEWGLDARLAETLREEGVKHFFPIQVLYCSYDVKPHTKGCTHTCSSCVN